MEPRLTVARASQAEREAFLERVTAPVVDATALAERARTTAAHRASERIKARNAAAEAAAAASDELAAAEAHLAAVAARPGELRAEADWLERAGAEIAAARTAVAEAEAVLAARQAEQRSALAALDRVLEQRATANAAMAEAEAELESLGVVEMDESALRRELEASGQAIRDAHEAHARAVAHLRALREELAAAVEEHAALTAETADAGEDGAPSPDAVDRVDAALRDWRRATAGRHHPDGPAMVQAWRDLTADLESVGAAGPLPDEHDLEAAEAAVRTTAARLAGIEGRTGGNQLTPEERAEIDAAHQAVVAAEAKLSRRIGAGAARRELEQAQAREDELLARHGFRSHLELTLSGGKVRRRDPELEAATAAYHEAVTHRDRLRARLESRPELLYLQRERTRLHGLVVDLLGVDPGPDVIGMLEAHPDVPAAAVHELRDALAAVGVAPVGVALDVAAAAWLADQSERLEELEARRAELAELRARAEALGDRILRLSTEVEEAERAEAAAAEAIELGARSVTAVETELTVRVDEDTRRLRRFAAAEQLRAQVEALTRTLTQAEREARDELEAATSALAEAETAMEQAADALGDLQRRVRDLTAAVPEDLRPDGDPLADLDALAAAVRAVAATDDDAIAGAEAARDDARFRHEVATATLAAAGRALEGPQPEDWAEVIGEALAGEGLLVLVEPLDERTRVAEAELLAALQEAAARRPLVLLTEDPSLLGWAIELPSEVARVVPLASLTVAADEASPQLVDMRAPNPSAEPPAAAPRWAGRR